jgi:hypothetical protein
VSGRCRFGGVLVGDQNRYHILDLFADPKNMVQSEPKIQSDHVTRKAITAHSLIDAAWR